MAVQYTKSERYRVNVSQTSTGKKGFECTVDCEGFTQQEILAKSDALVAELERRYPPEEQKGPALEQRRRASPEPAEKPTKTAQAVETGSPPADTP